MMDAQDTGRRLVWHGVLLFLSGLLIGIVVPVVTNPRMGLSAHVGTVMTGTFLIAAGFVWRQWPPAWTTAAFWLGLYGSYISCLGLLLAAVFGTSRSTPIAGAGHSAAAWQESVVNFSLTTSAVAMTVFCVLLLAGLRKRA